jgi:hypothetical protein
MSTDREALERLTEAVWLLFDNDWEHTNAMMQQEWIAYYVGPNETFLTAANSAQEDANNWANRLSFLNAYRDAVAHLMRTPK